MIDELTMPGKWAMKIKDPVKAVKKTNIEKILKELKVALHRLYGRRFLNLILYGSYARKEASTNSDIDVAVLLDGRVLPGREIDRMLDIITDINLKYNVLISVYPVSQESLETIKSPLVLNIRREGVGV